jgi:hypothetical protein
VSTPSIDPKGQIVQNTPIEATIYYRHSPGEIARLKAAIIPIADQLRRCSPGAEAVVNRVLDRRHFRVRDSEAMCAVLVKAAKQTRAHMDEYFPLMHAGLIAAAEELEDAVADYKRDFEAKRSTSLPIE